MGKKVNIVEVGLRDGLQNETVFLSSSIRLALARRLMDAGVKKIELGSFVSPRWVPQMAESEKLFKRALKQQSSGQLFSQVDFAALVPNEKGMEKAVSLGVKEVAIFASSTESFSQKNINCSIEESYRRFEPVIQLARKNKIKVRGYLSTVFGCPYEGEVKIPSVVKGVQRMLDLGVYEISLGDTIGVAHPRQVEKWVEKISKVSSLKKIAMHFHDTRGLALANISKSVDLGIRTFDASIGGLGGCPYAKGATGNVATEDVVYLLHQMGFTTGLDLPTLVKTNHWLSRKMNKNLPACISKIL